jgi:hypothetical protein
MPEGALVNAASKIRLSGVGFSIFSPASAWGIRASLPDAVSQTADTVLALNTNNRSTSCTSTWHLPDCT